MSIPSDDDLAFEPYQVARVRYYTQGPGPGTWPVTYLVVVQWRPNPDFVITSDWLAGQPGDDYWLPEEKQMFGPEQYEATITPVRDALMQGAPVPLSPEDGRDTWIWMALLDIIKEAIRDGHDIDVLPPVDWPGLGDPDEWIDQACSELEYGITAGMRPAA